MTFDLSGFSARAKDIEDWLTKEFGTIRTGRANPALLDSVQVESYGARVPINQVGNVGVEDPRTLRVSVWDHSQIKSVEKAITDSSLGLSVVVDDKGLRVIFPELTGERRAELIKQAKAKLEEARISIRSARDETVKKIEAEDLPEDDAFRAKEDLQKKVDDCNKILGTHFDAKEKEITE